MPRRSAHLGQHALQPPDPALQQTPGHRDGALRRRDLSDKVTVRVLAVELGFADHAPARPEKACRDWLTRWQVPTLRRGKYIVVCRRDVEHALRQAQPFPVSRTR
jgi:hypothetical protein